MEYNLILDTDSYKASHFLQLPPDTQGLFSYIESRGGLYDGTLFFGLQYILKAYLSKPVTHAMVDAAKAVWALHGEPFNERGWRLVVDRHGGFLPLKIRAVPEGAWIPTGNALVTVQSTDPELAWVASYVETLLLRVWYPLTVATRSFTIKQMILQYLRDTSDTPEASVLFKLHDFGARGVSSYESSAIGGLAHLVNFRGTDTISAVMLGREYYGEPMAGFSIPASEHSTITAWGKDYEVEAYRNMLRQFSGPGKMFACVADSYDVYNAVDNLFGGVLRESIQQSQGILVVRPDSGNPVEVSVNVTKKLHERFGSTVNGLGYKVLNNVRVIYGDGINENTIRGILMELKAHGFSADNIAFGMGGALLQQVNRDTQKMAMKASAVLRGGEWRDVFKDPVTDPGKASKKGLLDTYQLGRETLTFRKGEAPKGFAPLTRTVWENGELIVDDALQVIRERSAAILR